MQPTHSTNRTSRMRPVRRRGFTLVELLVVLTVMVTLATMMTYALASAQTDARIKRTQADVLSIGQLLQTRVSEISLSKMNLQYGRSIPQLYAAGSPQREGGALSNPFTPAVQVAEYQKFESDELARLILLARRDMMRMVLPECRRDLLYPPASLQFRTRATSAASAANRLNNWYPNVAQLKPPPQWNQMRTLAGLLSAETVNFNFTTFHAGTAATTNPEVDAITLANSNADFANLLIHDASIPYTGAGSFQPIAWTRQHESAECLYLILATTELFGKKAIDQIPSSRIRDTDGDNIPEILDAWEQPYVFLRNPIGLRSPAIKNFNASGPTEIEQYESDPDALDLLLVDFRYDNRFHPTPSPFTAETPYHPVYLPPAVISAGRNKQFGIRRTYVDDDRDGTPESGLNDAYSSSAAQMAAGSVGPTYPGIPVFRFPDPFFNAASVPIATAGPYNVDAAGTVLAKEGGGLGGYIVPDPNGDFREAAADNISSLDAGF